jgi:hypothetical protein
MKALRFFLQVVIVLLVSSGVTQAQTNFDETIDQKMNAFVSEKLLFPQYFNVILPSNNLQSVSTPSGWGGGNNAYMFLVVGGIFPALYTNPEKADLISTAGISVGNPVKFVNVSASLNITRVSELRDFSANLLISRQIRNGGSISVGGLQLFASKNVSDAPDPTFYIAYSHAVQSVKSEVDGFSALGYTIGFGTGRFLHKSPDDVRTGKGRYGTGVFASVSYEVISRLNLNAEWSGLNLGFSLGVRPVKQSAVTMGFGVHNLTRFSGDRPTFLALVGVPVFLKKNKQVVNP